MHDITDCANCGHPETDHQLVGQCIAGHGQDPASGEINICRCPHHSAPAPCVTCAGFGCAECYA